MRLKRIESKIQHIIYRVDRRAKPSPDIIQDFLDQLSAWKQAIPPEFNNRDDPKFEPFDGMDIFVRTILYYSCYSQLISPDDPVLQMCPASTILSAFSLPFKSGIPQALRRGLRWDLRRL